MMTSLALHRTMLTEMDPNLAQPNSTKTMLLPVWVSRSRRQGPLIVTIFSSHRLVNVPTLPWSHPGLFVSFRPQSRCLLVPSSDPNVPTLFHPLIPTSPRPIVPTFQHSTDPNIPASPLAAVTSFRPPVTTFPRPNVPTLPCSHHPGVSSSRRHVR
jgi:hypothetical protein